VDGKRKEVQISLLPAFVHLTSIGGIAIPVKHVTRLGSFVNYSGCISSKMKKSQAKLQND
jgi:hypothetical protein